MAFTMQESNKIIHGLWIGSKLSPIELLTLHSFIRQGHTFHLWVYEELDNELPSGLLLKDANEIIPQEHVFRKKADDPKHGIGRGSFAAPFSDLFRFKLLYEKGGWWTDMDVTCLKALDFDSPYFFRAHPLLSMIGNVMKCPPKSELMKRVYEETQSRCDENTEEWLLPNKILNQHIQQLQLTSFIQKELSNADNWEEVMGLIYQSKKLPHTWHFIHWMNEEWRRQNLDKNSIYTPSTLSHLMDQHDISHTAVPFTVRKYPWLAKKMVKESFLFPMFKWVKSKLSMQ